MGTLKARVGNAWVPVGGSGDEVFIGPDDPAPANAMVELWYDTDAPSLAAPLLYGIEASKPTAPLQPQRWFSIDTKRDWLYDGTGWIIMGEPPQAWTAAWANITLGTGGTANGITHRSDGYVDISNTLILGSSGFVMGANPVLTLPFAAASLRPNQLQINLDDGTALYPGINQAGSGGTTTTIYAVRSDQANSTYNTINATTPFAWGAGDGIEVIGRYQMVSRYT